MIKKRCPSCHKEIDVNPTLDRDTCSKCGEPYLIDHTNITNKKAGCSNGIRLHSIVTVKKCSHCHEEKLVEAFNKDSASNDGYNSWCRKCAAEANKLYRSGKRKRRYVSKAEIPACAPRMRLNVVFPALVKISRSRGKYTDSILNETIEGIKESIS